MPLLQLVVSLFLVHGMDAVQQVEPLAHQLNTVEDKSFTGDLTLAILDVSSRLAEGSFAGYLRDG